jgi:hypothetical protein
MDFTVKRYTELLNVILDSGYSPCTYSEFLGEVRFKSIVLRHDVDRLPENSLLFARMQNSMGVKGTYYFRAKPCSWDEKIIREISMLGHEIGYHYEDFGTTALQTGIKDEKALAEKAIKSFEKNLRKLREIAKVDTICMHGLPISRWDGRLLWKYYNYRDFGIKGEPYFDTDFSKVLYLTDTGRRWDGSSVSIRDRAESGFQKSSSPLQPESPIRTTNDLIKNLTGKKMPDCLMFTFHPQRWNDSIAPWLQELIFQNIKNTAKYMLIKLRR